jgi:hypothetical protein
VLFKLGGVAPGMSLRTTIGDGRSNASLNDIAVEPGFQSRFERVRHGKEDEQSKG